MTISYMLPRWGRAVLDPYKNREKTDLKVGHYKRQKQIPLPLRGIGMTIVGGGGWALVKG